MPYFSTRNKNLTASSVRAVLQGLAPDGGLYIRDDIPALGFDWRGTLKKDVYGMAEAILHALLPEFDGMDRLVELAYRGRFQKEELTPLVSVGDIEVLELFWGPTSAFKDVALSMLPRLITAARAHEGITERTVILTATSGDTGKAALAGFQDVPGTEIFVFYPENGVSPVQKAQMVTQQGANVRVCAVRGNFDDAQTGVKAIFSACADGKLLQGKNAALSSANSINVGRLAPQVVYYFKAYADLVKRGRLREGELLDFSVPTGNFGDILAGYLAKLLGLPVGRLICASNRNDVLTDFIRTGVYDRRREFYRTISPSMDILVSSNLERLLYLLCGDDAEVAGYMEQLRTEGCYTVSDALLQKLQAEFRCGFCDDETAKQTIGRVWREHGYLMDPHTAVGWTVAERLRAECPERALVTLSTASAYKFPAAVLSALGVPDATDSFASLHRLSALTGTPIPPNLAALETAALLHNDVIDKQDMLDYVLGRIGR